MVFLWFKNAFYITVCTKENIFPIHWILISYSMNAQLPMLSPSSLFLPYSFHCTFIPTRNNFSKFFLSCFLICILKIIEVWNYLTWNGINCGVRSMWGYGLHSSGLVYGSVADCSEYGSESQVTYKFGNLLSSRETVSFSRKDLEIRFVAWLTMCSLQVLSLHCEF